MKERFNKKIIQITIRIVIGILFILLIWVLLESLIFPKKLGCDSILEFKEIEDCSNECFDNCVKRGFSENLNHSLIQKKFSIESTIKKATCLCNCEGCIETK